jgi:hypothetical protein
LCITLVQFFLLGGGVSWWSDVVLQKHLLFPKWKTLIIYLLFYSTNHYLLIRCGHGIVFEREFSGIKRSRRTLLLTIGWLIIIGSVVLVLYEGLASPKRRATITECLPIVTKPAKVEMFVVALN